MSAYAQPPPQGYEDYVSVAQRPPVDEAEEEWMRSLFQPKNSPQQGNQQRGFAPQQQRGPPPQQREFAPMRGPDPRGDPFHPQYPADQDLYASTNSDTMSVLSNADDFTYDPSEVPREWFEQQPQYEIISVERPAGARGPAHQPYGRPMYGQHNFIEQPRSDYAAQGPGPIATIGVALWQKGRYFVVASITADSDASRCGITVGDAVRKINGYNLNGFTLDQANTFLKGAQGTVVELRTTWRKFKVIRDCAAQNYAPQQQYTRPRPQMHMHYMQPRPQMHMHYMQPQMEYEKQYVQGPPTHAHLQHPGPIQYQNMPGLPPQHDMQYVQGPPTHAHLQHPGPIQYQNMPGLPPQHGMQYGQGAPDHAHLQHPGPNQYQNMPGLPPQNQYMPSDHGMPYEHDYGIPAPSHAVGYGRVGVPPGYPSAIQGQHAYVPPAGYGGAPWSGMVPVPGMPMLVPPPRPGMVPRSRNQEGFDI